MCFPVKYLPSLTFSGTDTVYLKAPEMFQNLANNCTVNPNGKLITLSPSEKKKYSTMQPRATAGCHFTAQGGNIPPFIININKRQRQAIEERIKEKYYWQQADKKVVKAERKSEKRQRKMTMREKETEELVVCSSHYLAS